MSAAAVAAAAHPVVAAALRADPDAQARVRRLEGTAIAIEVTGLGWVFYLEADSGALRVTSTPTVAPAARIAGPPASLARLAHEGGARVLFSGTVEISGDVAVARAYKRLFDTLDPDWEEALAGIVGDIGAHEMGRGIRGIRGWLDRAVAGRRSDIRAWLTDELQAVPGRSEIEPWLEAVDRLRHDGDRLAARIARLERHGGGRR